MPSDKCVATFTFDGRRYYIRADTKEEARIQARLKKKELEDGKLHHETALTVNEWFGEYLATYKAGVLPKTKEDYIGIYNNGIKPYIGNMPLKAVKPINCQQVFNKNAARSASYIHKVKILLNGLFASAVDNDLINKNPSAKAVPPVKENGKRRALTEAERKAFLEASYKVGEAGLYCRIIYYCGLRPSEANRIRGGDYKGNILSVRGTKTKASARKVPIPAALVLPKIPKGELLFTTTNGGERGKDAQRRYWIKVKHQMMKDGYVADDLTLYCLRHDYCTRLQEAGIPIDVARRLMGHSSVEVTSKIYTHGTEKTLLSALDKINAVALDVAPTPQSVENSTSQP